MGNCVCNIANPIKDAEDPVTLQYNRNLTEFVQSGFDSEWAYFIVFGVNPRVVTIVGKQEFRWQIQQFIHQHITDYKFEPTIYPSSD